jgi:hypothetical protein
VQLTASGECSTNGSRLTSAFADVCRIVRQIGRTVLHQFPRRARSSGPTEAINLLIKKIKRVGHGFRNFDNYRLRLLLHCGVDWDTIQATLLRGRLTTLSGVEPDNLSYVSASGRSGYVRQVVM